MFENKIHNMNKTKYSDLHTYTESKIAFILSEEIKSSKMNKRSETKKSEHNSSGAADTGNIKNENYKHKK